jgi:6-phosphogluconolactonase/glucosamine-6-phosphate isomerase/deaminase
MRIEVFDDVDSVARPAAAAIAAEAQIAVAANGRVALASSGGYTPWIMSRALAEQDVPWSNVLLFIAYQINCGCLK